MERNWIGKPKLAELVDGETPAKQTDGWNDNAVPLPPAEYVQVGHVWVLAAFVAGTAFGMLVMVAVSFAAVWVMHHG